MIRKNIGEECGIFGIWGHENAAELTYLGLYSLQHRGQESAGIAVSDGKNLISHKGMGLVSDVFDQEIIKNLKGHIAIGHNRYSTTGSSSLINAQPICVSYKMGKLGVAHNGNLVNANILRKELERAGFIFHTSTDSEIMVHLVARSIRDTVPEMIADAVSHLEGSYSLIISTEDSLIAARDPHGFRPLCIGKLDDAFVIASESCALDIVGAEYIRDVKPGELILIDENGLETLQAHPDERTANCIFEFIYFSRPDSIVFGKSVDSVRRQLGRNLAKEHPVDADIVISVPDSSNTCALGFSQESGIPFEIGLIRNHYVGRTFIQPAQNMRDFRVRVKFNPVESVLKDKKVVVVDDSIVRGTTSKYLIKMLKQVNPKEIHFRVSSPPIKFPCFYGVDIPTNQELIAANHSVEEIQEYLGADSLGYLSIHGLLGATGMEDKFFCKACFAGDYPTKVCCPK
jgi:amidophosphoribosyltransferase